ncbi:MAG: hypothetical protein NZ749_00480 [bacterium]|nr:hypothetical protein [bacterium]
MRSFTGNPFVDAGIAAMCAASGVDAPEQLDMDAVHRAVETLYRVLLSDSAFVRREPYKVFATSTMSMLFPNSPLPQASFPTPEKKREKYRERVENLLWLLTAESQNADSLCFACGRPALLHVGIDRFPLMGSEILLNFHPMHTGGHPICAFCALAVQFLPFSVMQTKTEGGRLWFVHTPEATLSTTIVRDYTLPHLERLVAAGEPLRFLGNWACPGENGAIVSLLNEVAQQHATTLERVQSPVSVFLFSNDLRGQFLQRIPIPHQLLVFLNALQPYARRRFEEEVLRGSRGMKVAGNMLSAQPIIEHCLQYEERQLSGGWDFHQLYAREVLGMSARYVQTIQDVAQRVFASEDGEKVLNALRLASDQEVFSVLLRMVRDGWMNRQELQALAPPGALGIARQTRDYLLGALYALQSGETFEALPIEPATEQQAHPLVQRIEQVGETLVSSQRDEAKKLLNHLRQSSRPQDVRGAFLRLLATGGMGWRDFLFFCPPDEAGQHYQSRDYWLAFLYDRLRQEIEETDITELEEV